MNFSLDPAALNTLCPMHLVLSPMGHIVHAGPTIQKMFGDNPLVGARFLEAFNVKRPLEVSTMRELLRLSGKKMHLIMHAAKRTELKGVLMPLADENEGALLNLSFGISILEGVRDYQLSNSDFAVTDLAIEMLYLVEAKTAAMESSRKLNQKLQGAKAEAEQKAYTDTLTGLKNRRTLDFVLTKLVAKKAAFAVMHIDLDYFKAVNDTFGHAAGDHVLREVGRIMTEETRASDTVARVGGDEFTLVLPNIRDEDVLRRVGKRLISRLELPIVFEGNDCRISASIGTVWIQSGQETDKETLLSDADVALYASKRAGRACQTLYSPELRKTDGADRTGPIERRSAPS